MNRAHYFNYIEEKLSNLATRIELRGKLNILDLNMHSENFYQEFFNLLFSWNLTNLNAVKQNVEAIDLIDPVNKIVIQVSSTATKQKIESSLSKDLSAYKDYAFKFISISKDASSLRSQPIKNPHGLKFDSASDIHDVKSILNFIVGLGIDEQRSLFLFIKKELGSEIDLSKIESNLATIISILAKENWAQGILSTEVNPYEVDRKISHNNLNVTKYIIEDYSVHYGRVDQIYSEFSKQGVNKSISVLGAIRSVYSENKILLADDALFFKVIEEVLYRIQESANYQPIALEELELCVNILVVDAFIRCKIFENPTNYKHATA